MSSGNGPKDPVEVSEKGLHAQALAADIANFGSQKEQRTKAAQAKLKAAKTALEASKKAAKESAQKLTQAAAEAEAAANERQSLAEQVQAAQNALQGMPWQRHTLRYISRGPTMMPKDMHLAFLSSLMVKLQPTAC